MRAQAAALLFCLAGVSPAAADEAAAVDRFLGFISNGCINAIVAGTGIGDFAERNAATPADEALSAAVLGTDKGTVFAAADPTYPLAIAERDGGPCTVNARFPGDLAAMIEATDDFLAGPGGGFYPVRVFEESAGAAGWTTHRVYLGQRRGRKITLLLSTTPGAATIDQVFFAAAATK